MISAALVSVLIIISSLSVESREIKIYNKCPFTTWVGILGPGNPANELLDGGLRKKKHAFKTRENTVDSASDEPQAKRIRVEADDCNLSITVAKTNSESLRKLENPELSDQTESIKEISTVNYSEEFTLLNDFCWEYRSEEERKRNIMCDDMSSYEIYHTIRTKSHRLPIPCIFFEKGDIKSTSTPLKPIFDAEALKKNCRSDTDTDRRKAILKLFSQRYGLKLTSETLHLGVALLDKCLNSLIIFPETLVELACVAMIIASKVEEVNFLTLRDALVCGLIRDKPIKLLCKLEQVVLKTVEFEVTFPTPLTFANYLLVKLGALPSKINMTHYLLELAVLCVSIRQYSSDHIAHAATCLAYAIDFHASSTPVKSLCQTEFSLQDFSKILPGTTRDLMKILVAEFQSASSEEHEIYSEYARSGRDSVALRRIDDELVNMVSFSR